MQRKSWASGVGIVVAVAFCASGCGTESHPKIDGGPIVIDAEPSPGDAHDGVAEASASASDALDALGDVNDASVDGDAHIDCPGPSDPMWPPPTVQLGSAYYVGATPRGSNSLLVPDATLLWTATAGPGQTGAGAFTDPTASFTTFTCTQAGDLQITVHVFLPGTSCDSSLSWAEHCQP